MIRTTKQTAVLAAACAAALVLAACSSSKSNSGSGGGASSGGSVNIAFTTELTGGLASTFSPTASGVKAAVADINGKGGINGKKINLTGPLDSQSTPAGGTTAAQQAVGGKPTVVLSLGSSGEVSSGAPVYTQAGVPWADISGALPKSGMPNHFSINLTGDSIGLGLLKQAASSLNNAPLKIAIAELTSPAVQGIVAGIKAHAGEFNATIVADESTTTGLTSFTSQAAKIVRTNPNVVMPIDSVTNTVLEASAIITAGYKGLMLGSNSTGNPAALSKINLPNFAGFQQTQLAAQGDGLYQAAAAVSATDVATTNNYFSAGYMAVEVVASILGKCGTTCKPADFQKTAETMGDITVPNNAAFGPIRFTADNHYGVTAMQFFKWDTAGKTRVAAGPPVTF